MRDGFFRGGRGFGLERHEFGMFWMIGGNGFGGIRLIAERCVVVFLRGKGGGGGQS